MHLTIFPSVRFAVMLSIFPNEVTSKSFSFVSQAFAQGLCVTGGPDDKKMSVSTKS